MKRNKIWSLYWFRGTVTVPYYSNNRILTLIYAKWFHIASQWLTLSTMCRSDVQCALHTDIWGSFTEKQHSIDLRLCIFHCVVPEVLLECFESSSRVTNDFCWNIFDFVRKWDFVGKHRIKRYNISYRW